MVRIVVSRRHQSSFNRAFALLRLFAALTLLASLVATFGAASPAHAAGTVSIFPGAVDSNNGTIFHVSPNSQARLIYEGTGCYEGYGIFTIQGAGTSSGIMVDDQPGLGEYHGDINTGLPNGSIPATLTIATSCGDTFDATLVYDYVPSGLTIMFTPSIRGVQPNQFYVARQERLDLRITGACKGAPNTLYQIQQFVADSDNGPIYKELTHGTLVEAPAGSGNYYATDPSGQIGVEPLTAGGTIISQTEFAPQGTLRAWLTCSNGERTFIDATVSIRPKITISNTMPIGEHTLKVTSNGQLDFTVATTCNSRFGTPFTLTQVDPTGVIAPKLLYVGFLQATSSGSKTYKGTIPAWSPLPGESPYVIFSSNIGCFSPEIGQERLLVYPQPALPVCSLISPGNQLNSGNIAPTAEMGSVITGLTPGSWYAIETRNGPWYATGAGANGTPQYGAWVSNDEGDTWYRLYMGAGDGNDFTNHWGAFAGGVNTNYHRGYWRATGTNIRIRVADGVGSFTDNSGTLSWTLFATSPCDPHPQETLSFTAEADARVNSRRPLKNFGNALDLIADGADHPRSSYLRFTITVPAGKTITSATLRLGVIDGTTKGPNVYATNNNWDENAITWNNRPPIGQFIASSGVIASGSIVEYSVLSAINGANTYSFVLVGTGNNSVKFYSREYLTPPTLVVTIQ